MGDDRSARWALPLLQPGQAQKEMVHNEALARLDLLAQASALAAGVDTPPAAPDVGDCWIVGDTPTGVWAGQPRCLAGWTANGWRFVTPVEGMTVWVNGSGLAARFVDGEWAIGNIAASAVTIAGNQVLGDRQPAIADPAGGSVADVESRAALASILGTLRSHGLIEN